MTDLYTKEGYYQIAHDFEAYPDAVVYIVVGGRGTGKTYGTLKYMIENEEKFVFLKRTKDDIHMMCSGSGKIGTALPEGALDYSPFKVLNNDMGWNIHPIEFYKGFGAFYNYETSEDGKEYQSGAALGYIAALSLIGQVKGFEMADATYQIFDEFIPLRGQIVKQTEGENALDLYKTIDRSRTVDGAADLKAVFLANASVLNNQIFQALDLIDIAYEMKAFGITHKYIEDRYIFIRFLDDNQTFRNKEKNSKIYAAAGKNSKWTRSALENDFAYDDTSRICRKSLNGYSGKYVVKYNNGQTFYMYRKGKNWYTSNTPHNVQVIYNCDTDAGRLAFGYELYDLRQALAEDRLFCESFSHYAFIRDFKKGK